MKKTSQTPTLINRVLNLFSTPPTPRQPRKDHSFDMVEKAINAKPQKSIRKQQFLDVVNGNW